jgi:hypothetical protein
MNYFIQRDGQQYGPYTLADLQRYVASGEVLLTDLATSEASSEPLPVSQIVGTIVVASPAIRLSHGDSAPDFPSPPNLHWGLVLLFDFLSCGMFAYAWDIVQSVWMRKLEPESKALYYYVASAACMLGIFVAAVASAMARSSGAPITGLLQIAGWVLLLVGRFSFRSSMEGYFNEKDPMGLSLSGVMTFFFGHLYFQYHINDIVRRKQQDLAFEMAR